MARRMFYADEVRGRRAWIHGETAEHLRRVLRVEAGQQFEISDKATIHLATVVSASKSAVEFELVEAVPARRQGANITVFAALIKFDHFEWMLEKCSELGVAVLTPVITAQTETGLDKAATKRLPRWTRIAEESGQQCRRVAPIRVTATAEFPTVVTGNPGARFLLDEAGGTPLLKCLPEGLSEAALLIGPEGGWTDAEREAAALAGWTRVSLGEQILRAETAAVAAVSQIQGRWWSTAGA